MTETRTGGGVTDASDSSRPDRVPPPKPPDDPEAWYAPDVRAQYELHPGVVATIAEANEGFDYCVREPSLSPTGEEAFERVDDHFADANLARPLTREGVEGCIRVEP